MISRNLYSICFSGDFGKQMRFIAGPRQCGKTTIAKEFLAGNRMEGLYFNWDDREIKQRYLKNSSFYKEHLFNRESTKRPWVCMDEIHKFPGWKNILKTFYDRDGADMGFIITGSARLDLFRKSGDSLAGRFFLFRLYPLVLNELSRVHPPCNDSLESAWTFVEKRMGTVTYEQDSLERLLRFSGFPDPLLSGNAAFHTKWKNGYLDKLIHEDLRTLAQVKEVENISRLFFLLTDKVGSPLSVNSLVRDMLVSYNAIKNYLALLELAYIIFFIPPYTQKISRSIKKERKLYFLDYTHLSDRNSRFENYVAIELKALIEIWNDRGNEFDLFYLRTKDGKESDFLITRERVPWLLIEIKSKRQTIARHHYNSAEKLGGIPVLQIVRESNVAEKQEKGYQVSASRFFA